MSVKDLEKRTEDIAVRIAQAHVRKLKQIWRRHHYQRRNDKSAIEKTRKVELEADRKISELERELTKTYGELSIFLSLDESACRE